MYPLGFRRDSPINAAVPAIFGIKKAYFNISEIPPNFGIVTVGDGGQIETE